MNPNTYSTDPSDAAWCDAYESQTPLTRLLYRDVLDIMWRSEDHYRLAVDASTLSAKLGMSTADVETAITTLADPECGLLLQDYDISTGEISLRSPHLQSQWKAFSEYAKRQDELAEKKNAAQTKGLAERYSNRKDKDSATARYLAADKRYSQSFTDWLPTSRFDTNGQTYILRQDVLTAWEEKFPAVDVRAELGGLYQYLLDNPARRRSLANMNGWIETLLENKTHIPGRRQTQKDNGQPVDSISNAFDDLFKEAAGA